MARLIVKNKDLNPLNSRSFNDINDPNGLNDLTHLLIFINQINQMDQKRVLPFPFNLMSQMNLTYGVSMGIRLEPMSKIGEV
jgi:hypothetical protein